MSYSELDKLVQYLKGVGPQRAKLLAKLNIQHAREMLFHAPHRYEDASTVQKIEELEPGMDGIVVGRVVSKGVLPTRRGLRIFQAIVRDRTGYIECAWPGQAYLDRVIEKGDLMLLSGKIRFFHGKQMQPREFEILARHGERAKGTLGAVIPIYPATEGLSHRQIRRVIDENLDDLLRAVELEDSLPPQIRERLGLPPLADALRMVHRPQTLAEAETGRRRLAFDELFVLQLLHARSRLENSVVPGTAFTRRNSLVRQFYESLPFELTAAQKRVLAEIGDDMATERRMNRLLQGDVGSGKTVVALFAMLRAVENGYQAALMAPTEILAEQHARTLEELLSNVPVEVQLLTGRMPAAERREALDRVASGAAHLVVGTHAVIQESVEFHKLGIGVIDEQHRFGVRQRLALAEMGDAPDVLVMSATPIPRSLALTLYGDLDISVIDERPPGRQPIRTEMRRQGAEPKVLDFIREQSAAGRQAYIVYPLVEESETLELRSATEEFDRLGREFPELRLGLIHGQLAADEKDAVMVQFAAGELDVLVSTTVIEVGIDVPNATVMVIQHAERFGLSQLHQLRGRVGRGGSKSYCILLTDHAGASSRLQVLCSTEDGFAIAEADLRIRGQGDLFGARQSGVPAFRFADLEKDISLLTAAREEAQVLVADDPELSAHPRLAAALESRYGDRTKLFQTG